MLSLRSVTSSQSFRRFLTSSVARRDAFVPLWINGRNVNGGSSTFEVRHPRSGDVVSRVATASPADMCISSLYPEPRDWIADHGIPDCLSEAALSSSWEAFKSWSATPAAQRRSILNKVAQLLVERKEELTASYQRETSVSGLITEVDYQYTTSHVAEAAAPRACSAA